MARTGAIRAGRAYVELFADNSKLIRGLHRAETSLKKFGKTVRELGLKMMAVSAALGAPLVASIKIAGDAIETLNKFKQVFGDLAGEAGKFADAVARSVGRSRDDIRDQMSSMQAFFVGLKFDPSKAFAMTRQVERLSLDFASLYNISDQDAIEKFQSGLAGMSRPLREFGINLLDSAVQAEALRLGLSRNASELTEQQKVVARLSLIYRSMTSQGAVGDATRTAGSFNNRLKALKGTIHDTAVEVGNSLLPVVTPLLGKLVDAVKVIGEWVRKHHDAVVVVAKSVVALGAAGVAFYTVGGTMASFGWTLAQLEHLLRISGRGLGLVTGAARKLFGLLKLLPAVLTAIISPEAIVIATLAGFFALVLWGTGAAGKALDWLKGRFTALKDDAVKAFGGIKDALVAGDLKLAARIFWLTLKLEWQKGTLPLRKAWQDAIDGMKAAWEIVTDAIARAWNGLITTLETLWAKFSARWKRSQIRLGGWLAKRWVDIQGAFDSSVDTKFQKNYIDQRTQADLRSVDTEEKKRTDSLDAEHRAAVALLKAQHEKAMAQIGKENMAKIKAAEGAVAAAQKEWQAALDKAKAERTAGSGAEGAGGGPPKGKLPDIGNLVGGMAAAAARGATVRGTFSGTGLWGLGTGNGSAMDRTARATEQTAKNTEHMRNQMQNAGIPVV